MVANKPELAHLIRRTDLVGNLLHPDLRDPRRREPEAIGGGDGHVDHAAAGKGPTIIHRDDDRAVVEQVGHPHLRAEGQRPMRGRKRANPRAARRPAFERIIRRLAHPVRRLRRRRSKHGRDTKGENSGHQFFHYAFSLYSSRARTRRPATVWAIKIACDQTKAA